MLECRSLTRIYGATRALDDFDLTVLGGSIAAVIGPSGCGKTTLLRVLSGLEQQDAGSIVWDGRDVSSTPTHQRGFGLMFQDFALFPHRTVGENVAFGLRMAGMAQTGRTTRVAEVLELVGLTGYVDRPVTMLSGGEQQRVALARTLAPQPRLVLLDEPLGSLDRTLSDRLIVEMHDIFEALGVTVVYVTHDQGGAFAIADHLIVMREGRAVASGSTEDVWRRPGTEWVARFLGHENIIEAGSPGAAVAIGTSSPHLAGTASAFAVPAAAVSLREDPAGPGTVESVTFRGGSHRVRVAIGDLTLVADVHSSPVRGARVAIDIPPDSVIPLTG